MPIPISATAGGVDARHAGCYHCQTSSPGVPRERSSGPLGLRAGGFLFVPWRPMKKVSFLIDGFNVYHSLQELQKMTGKPVKWLDLRKLCGSYIQKVRAAIGERVEIAGIHYFSALAMHKRFAEPGVIRRHQDYIRALESTGVSVTLSAYKQRPMKCHHCKAEFWRPEEKETDVAIAVKLIEVFARAECDAAVVVSGDTDLLPAVRTVKALFGGAKKVGIGFPFNRRNNEPQTTADFYFQIQQKEICSSQFPPVVKCEDGKTVEKPRDW